jgi:hypothetical protein
MKKIMLSCSLLLFCILISAQNSVSLKLNLTKNKVYRFSSASDQTIIQTINGNQQTIESKTINAVSIKMIDATADFLVTEVRFDTLITNTNSMGKTSNITSVSAGDIKSSETSDIMSCIMNRLSKNALYVKMDYAGRVLEIVNAKMLSDLIMKDTSSITLTGIMASSVKTQIQNLVSDNTLKTMVELFTHYLPGREVSKGDSWNISMATNSGGMSLDINTTYHLDEVNGITADISSESDIKAAANAVPMEAGGAKISYDDLKGLSKSTILIDISTGLLLEENAKTHIAGTLGISVQGMNLQMPMDINGTSRVIALQ